MARIRTIKPEFFRHEELQRLGTDVMLVFAGLWTQCDSRGRFQWRPRQLKLDILPFIDFDMEAVLGKLESSGFVTRYEVNGKKYGFIPTFRTHQRITGKEASDGEKYPEPVVTQRGNNGESAGKQQGNDGERQDVQEREREREREKEIKEGEPDGPLPVSPVDKKTKSKKPEFVFTLPEWIPSGTWDQFVEMRKKIKKPLTPYGSHLIVSELESMKRKQGHDPVAVLNESIKNSWQGVFPLKESSNGSGGEYGRRGSGRHQGAEIDKNILDTSERLRRKYESPGTPPEADPGKLSG